VFCFLIFSVHGLMGRGIAEVKRACQPLNAVAALELCAGTYDTPTREAALSALAELQRF
jgi:hypothetical protein